jgi:hypothetical protein
VWFDVMALLVAPYLLRLAATRGRRASRFHVEDLSSSNSTT